MAIAIHMDCACDIPNSTSTTSPFRQQYHAMHSTLLRRGAWREGGLVATVAPVPLIRSCPSKPGLLMRMPPCLVDVPVRQLVRGRLPDGQHLHGKGERLARQRMIRINDHGVLANLHDADGER